MRPRRRILINSHRDMGTSNFATGYCEIGSLGNLLTLPKANSSVYFADSVCSIWWVNDLADRFCQISTDSNVPEGFWPILNSEFPRSLHGNSATQSRHVRWIFRVGERFYSANPRPNFSDNCRDNPFLQFPSTLRPPLAILHVLQNLPPELKVLQHWERMHRRGGCVAGNCKKGCFGQPKNGSGLQPF